VTALPRFARSVSARGVRWAAIIAVVACGRQEPAKRDSVVAAAPPAPATPTRADTSASPAVAAGATATPATSTCISEGEWQQCSVAKRLTDAGYVPIEKGASPPGIFPVPGTKYALGNAEMHVYVFKSAKDRATAVAGIDTVAVARRGTAAVWPLPPTLISANNVAAVLVSDNGRLIERVQNALMAGLPRASRIP
jgi:hypothetical protein